MTEPSDELDKKARVLLDAAYDYWKQMQKEGKYGALFWLDDADGHTVIFTRGEYRGHLLGAVDGNYHRLRKQFHHLQDADEMIDDENINWKTK
jgi:hypothetical protein